MRRIADGTVGAEVIDGIALVLPGVGEVGAGFGGDHGWQDTVVVNVVPVVAGCRRDNDAFEPLDAAAADLARNDYPERLAVVGVERFAVHLVGDHDASLGVHGPAQPYGCAVVPVGKLVGTLKEDILCSPLWPGSCQQIAERDARPERRRDACGTPGETLALSHHILLFPPVARAHKCDGVGDLLIVADQIPQGHRDRPLHQTLDGKLPVEHVVVFDSRHGAMVPDIVEILGRQEAFVIEVAQGGLDVEGVHSGESNEPGVSLHVAVGCSEILVQNLVLLGPRREGIRSWRFLFQVSEAEQGIEVVGFIQVARVSARCDLGHRV